MNTCTREHLCIPLTALSTMRLRFPMRNEASAELEINLVWTRVWSLAVATAHNWKKTHMYYIQGLVCSLTSQSYTWTYKWIIVENFFTTCIHSAACLSDDRRGGFTSRSGWLAYCMSRQSPRRAISFHPPSDSTSHTDRLSSRAIISSIN